MLPSIGIIPLVFASLLAVNAIYIRDEHPPLGSNALISPATALVESRCPRGYNGPWPFVGDCFRYVQCRNGYHYRVRYCASGSAFNAQSKQCEVVEGEEVCQHLAGAAAPVEEASAPSALPCDGFDCHLNGLCISSDLACNGHDDCGNNRDELDCPALSEAFSLHLQDSGSNDVHPSSGQLEVHAFGQVGAICSDGFGIKEATVACRELGFRLGAFEVSPAEEEAERAAQTHLLDQVSCRGDEPSLARCYHSGWSPVRKQCAPGGQRPVRVVCKVAPPMRCAEPEAQFMCETEPKCVGKVLMCDGVPDCADGSDEWAAHCGQRYRLVGGGGGGGGGAAGGEAVTRVGRVEVLYKGYWGTVCDSQFGYIEATVLCRSLGFTGDGSVVRTDPANVENDGAVWLADVQCSGKETSLQECSRREYGDNDCDHSMDVSVQCEGPQIRPTEPPAPRPTTTPPSIPSTENPSTSPSCGRIQVADRPSRRAGTGHHKRYAHRGQHPWQASLCVRDYSNRAKHQCGGTVLDKWHILTAAHCVQRYAGTEQLLVRVGEHNHRKPSASRQDIAVRRKFVHHLFRQDPSSLLRHDIALLRLTEPIAFGDHVQPICLPAAEEADSAYEPDRLCTISGWGASNGRNTTQFESRLRSAMVPLVPDELCRRDTVHGAAVTDGMFCAGWLQDSRADACQGDSGGPLVCSDAEAGVHSLVGIISWGDSCGRSDKPGVYVKVADYLEWIEDRRGEELERDLEVMENEFARA